jgi:hypothetical protein
VGSHTLPLNQRLEFSNEEARTLLQQASIAPDYSLSLQTFLSDNGEWLIKRASVREYLYSCRRKDINADTVVKAAAREFGRLQSLGLNVISRGFVLLEGADIVTITPHLARIQKCSMPDFRRHAAPSLLVYYQQIESQLPHLYLEDVGDNGQYSKLFTDGTPFLHDVEPYLADDRPLLDSKLHYLSAVAILK